jgi:hypothetical protein
LLKEADIPEENFTLMENTDNGDFNILRSVMMNPLAPGLPERYYIGFWEKVKNIAEESLEIILKDIISSKFRMKRVKVLWIENRDSVEKLKDAIETSGLGRFFAFNFVFENKELIQLNKDSKEDKKKITGDASIVISDLCLDGHHGDNIDINKVFPIINKCYLEGKQIICFSRYLSDQYPKAENVKNGILNELTLRYPDQKISQIHFLGKSTNFEEFEKTRFSGFANSKEMHLDMELLMKKMILALQRIPDNQVI